MAGGKETPRQKMIGMMYLVLTALLALQVSSAVLEKFAIINETLLTTVSTSTGKNSEQLKSIVEDGSKSSNPKVKRAVENAVKVREITTSTLAYMDDVKKAMMAEAGAEKIDGKLINDHSSKVAVMMIDPKSTHGKGFETKLKDFEKQLNELTGGKVKFESLTKAPKDIPLFASDDDHVRKDFLTFTFENTPAIAALASVTQVQTEILENESLALDYLAAEAGASVVKFDRVVPMVRAVSNTVAAGAPYEADLFMAASSSALSPTMTVDGKPLKVEDDISGLKMGRVKFTASGGGYDAKGIAKRTLVAKITLPDTTYTQNIEYFVAKPVIRVTTGTAPTLYMGCGNDVNIEVPALGTSYNPTFSATGAEIIKGANIGRVIIIPSQRKVVVNVSNAGTNLGSEPFDVKNVPRPRIVAKDNNGRDIDLKNGIKAGAVSGLRINAQADENFKAEVPKDANFRIRNMSVILARGTARVQEMTLTSELVDLSAWRAQMRPGDRIVIEPKNVVRMTFKGGTEQIVVSGQDIVTIPIQ
jgi:gliding motility-associated protein GldM